MNKTNKMSLNASNQKLLVTAPLVIGIIIIVVAVILQIIYSKNQLEEDIAKYEAYIYDNMESEVLNAMIMINLYYNSYVDELSEEEMTAGIREILTNLKPYEMDYFFATDYEGNVITGPGEGKNQYEVEDKYGTKIVQELIKIAQSGGGFFEYYLPDLDGMEQAPKVSYVLPFEPYGWYVGVGMLMSQIEAMRQAFYQDAMIRSMQIFVVLGLVVAIIMYFMSRINRKIYHEITEEINHIEKFLKKSKDDFNPLDTSEFQYEELIQIGSLTCKLFKAQYENQALLEETNCSLEEEISLHAHALEMLQESEQRFSSIVNTLPDIIFILDRLGNFVDVATNKKWILEDNNDYIGMNLVDILPFHLAEESMKNIERTLIDDQVQFQEYHLMMGSENCSYEARFVKYNEEKVFIILRNTTELNKALYNYEYLSYHDQLTSLYNRRYLDETILKIDLSEDLPITIAMIDLNGLKLINDAFGHSVGDEVLMFVADKLKEVCPVTGYVARVGGDEFVMVSKRTSSSAMKEILEELYQKVRKEFRYGIIVSISAGYDTRIEAFQSTTEILKSAEKQMYENKIVESQSMRNQAVQAIVKTLNEKNEREKLHSERVSVICGLIGRAMKLDHITNKRLETAGLLHDIGKISVSDAVLNKEGKLTEEEYEEIKRHPESSYQILKSIDAYAGLAEDVLSHHERMDGRGYPRGIKGDDISLIARIICVADAYEAMTATRSYRLAMPKETALDELKRNSGSQFDPEIVEIFEKEVFQLL